MNVPRPGHRSYLPFPWLPEDDKPLHRDDAD